LDEGVQHQIEGKHLHWDVVLKKERCLHQRLHHEICKSDQMVYLNICSLCEDHYIPRKHIILIKIGVYGYYMDGDGASMHTQNFEGQNNMVFD
jgi:transcription elongation factor Elf1